MIYLPSPEAVAREVEASLTLTSEAALAVVNEVYLAIDRCTTQKIVLVKDEKITPFVYPPEVPK